MPLLAHATPQRRNAHENRRAGAGFIGQALVEQDAALAGEAKTWENLDSRERRAAI
jgi:hypothetical protein